MKNSINNLKVGFNKANKAIEEASLNIRKKLATEMFYTIVKRSPIYTGSYLGSNNIGVNIADKSVTWYDWGTMPDSGWPLPISASKIPEIKTIAFQKLSKLNNTQPFDSITLSNNISHAKKVEYIGWKNKSAYHVYGLTYGYFLEKSKSMIKQTNLKLDLKIKGL